jgi:hypothetical protein
MTGLERCQIGLHNLDPTKVLGMLMGISSLCYSQCQLTLPLLFLRMITEEKASTGGGPSAGPTISKETSSRAAGSSFKFEARTSAREKGGEDSESVPRAMWLKDAPGGKLAGCRRSSISTGLMADWWSLARCDEESKLATRVYGRTGVDMGDDCSGRCGRDVVLAQGASLPPRQSESEYNNFAHPASAQVL